MSRSPRASREWTGLAAVHSTREDFDECWSHATPPLVGSYAVGFCYRCIYQMRVFEGSCPTEPLVMAILAGYVLKLLDLDEATSKTHLNHSNGARHG